jgi:hypothetical protein
MKYLITESRLNDSIETYLKENFDNVVDVKFVKKTVFLASEDRTIESTEIQILIDPMKVLKGNFQMVRTDVSEFRRRVWNDLNYTFGLKIEEYGSPWDIKLNMRYQITDKQLEGAIFLYLDNQDFIEVNYTYETYFVNSTSDKQGVIRYDGRDEVCYIDINLIIEVSGFFALNEEISKHIIADWVQYKLNVNVKHVSFVGEFFSQYLRMRN